MNKPVGDVLEELLKKDIREANVHVFKEVDEKVIEKLFGEIGRAHV